MKRTDYEPIDIRLNEVHTLLTRMMSLTVTYELTSEDIESIEQAEERLNDVRNHLWQLAKE